MDENTSFLPEEVLLSKIYLIRNQKVMLDRDLAKLYNVETKRLNEQVKRNIKRFPPDFMFQLTIEETQILKSQFATSSWGGRRTLPYAFTEHGILMLSSVLKSPKAVEVNIHIMRIFIKMRKLLSLNKNLLERLVKIEKKVGEFDQDIALLMKYLKYLMKDKKIATEHKDRKLIGFKSSKK